MQTGNESLFHEIRTLNNAEYPNRRRNGQTFDYFNRQGWEVRFSSERYTNPVSCWVRKKPGSVEVSILNLPPIFSTEICIKWSIGVGGRQMTQSALWPECFRRHFSGRCLIQKFLYLLLFVDAASPAKKNWVGFGKSIALGRMTMTGDRGLATGDFQEYSILFFYQTKGGQKQAGARPCRTRNIARRRRRDKTRIWN